MTALAAVGALIRPEGLPTKGLSYRVGGWERYDISTANEYELVFVYVMERENVFLSMRNSVFLRRETVVSQES